MQGRVVDRIAEFRAQRMALRESANHRLAHKGTIVLVLLSLAAIVATIQIYRRSAPPLEEKLLQSAWRDYAKAALSRDADTPMFNREMIPFDKEFAALGKLDQKIAAHTDSRPSSLVFHSRFAELGRCRDWLLEYRNARDGYESAVRTSDERSIEDCAALDRAGPN